MTVPPDPVKAAHLWIEKAEHTLTLADTCPFDMVCFHSGAGFEVAGLQMLNRYSVESRYPGEWEPITRDEAAGAVATAKCVKSAIAAILSRSNPSHLGKSGE